MPASRAIHLPSEVLDWLCCVGGGAWETVLHHTYRCIDLRLAPENDLPA